MNHCNEIVEVGHVSNKATNIRVQSKKCDNNLIVVLINIRSLRKKLIDLEIYLESFGFKPHIIIITETWLYEDELKFFNLIGYQSVANCRQNQRGGGILMFIKDDIKFNILKNEQFAKSHLIMINLNEINTKIAGFYRSPSTRLNNFWTF